MRDLDETDLEILQLLLSNARRPYSDIADVVGLSPPAVSDRVSRLQETGRINGSPSMSTTHSSKSGFLCW